MALHELDIWSKANGVCDSLAKIHWTQCKENMLSHNIIEFQSEGWKVFKDGVKLSSMNKKLVYAALHKPCLLYTSDAADE